jgi:hypothetical protein
MPYVNGKFYMNPAYGRAVEGSRGHKVALQSVCLPLGVLRWRL